ncbi:MAG: polysaccharide deacetylase family protein, partial [Solirubrobacterales bacterium]|nr:polysaccharide deacetylase family protein [Solirubrobacterales bacterium]
DTTPPTITAVLPTKGQTIQALGKVNANYSCADNLAVQSCVGTVANGSQLDTTTLGDHEFTVTATDTAGNRSTADLGYTVANNTLPTITIDGPTDAQSFNWNQSANAKYGCSSPVGVVSCVGTVTAAGTASDPAGTSTPVANGGALPMAGAPGPGTRTLTVTATDTYGGVSTKAVNYTVKPAGYYALTFDDGPDASFTQPILDELHQYGATAAFFLIGQNVAQYPALAKAEVDAGMTVGDHTWDHSAIAVDPSGGNPAPVPYTCPTAPPNRQPAANECAPWQLEDASDAIFNATGVRPHFFRPPYGSYDTGTIALLNSLPAPYNGMALAAWTTDTNDWAGATTSEIVQAALTVPSGGVILMHDAQQTTVVAVPQIITQMADTRGMLPGKLAVGGDWVGPFCGPAGDPCPPPFQPNWSVSAVAPAS